MGTVEGLFIEKESTVQKAIGSYIYFGEILGKHSEVRGTLGEDDLKTIELPEEAIEILESSIGGNISGYNPLDYISCIECGCHEDDCWCCPGCGHKHCECDEYIEEGEEE
jgi:hypothetical protein